MKKNIVLYKRIPDDQQAKLAAYFNVTYFDGINDQNREQVKAALAKAEGIIGASSPIGAELLDCAPHLKAISTISVGVDQFDIADLNQRNIRLMHTPGALTDTTADTIFTLVLATARRAVELSMMVRAGKWQNSLGEAYYGVNVHHKTIGILGMGRIGCAVAKRAYAGFDMNVLYMNHSANQTAEQQYHAKRCELDELLKLSDFVVITLPLTNDTTHLINQDKLRLMKPSAILINGARGKIIDQNALIDALKNNTIRAAGLDVFEVEPLPAESPLMTLDNVVLTPHIGSATDETRYDMVVTAVNNLIAALKADKPNSNWFNPQVS